MHSRALNTLVNLAVSMFIHRCPKLMYVCTSSSRTGVPMRMAFSSVREVVGVSEFDDLESIAALH